MSKNCIVAQSGGPTAAINASLAGVVAAARDFGIYDKIYGAIHGIQGVLKKHFLDLSDKDDAFIQKIARTPAMYLGSCRFKLPDMKDDVSMYEEIFSIFESPIRVYLLQTTVSSNLSAVACEALNRISENADGRRKL